MVKNNIGKRIDFSLTFNIGGHEGHEGREERGGIDYLFSFFILYVPLCTLWLKILHY
jgi:hypothetical protein